MRLRKRRMRRWIALAVAATAVAAPAGQAGHYDRGTPRQKPVDFWNYDSQTGRKIANSSPGLRAENLAQLWSASGSEPSVEIPYLSHGVGVSERDLGLSVHPDSRSLTRTSAPDLAPDDRAVPRATSVAAPALDLAPDDRVVPRPTPVTPTPVATSAPDLAPDDRAVPRPIPVSKRASDPREPGVAAANADGFDWAAALVGGTFGVAFALLATGGLLLAHRRDRTPTTA
jgi:hypothetical protein